MKDVIFKSVVIVKADGSGGHYFYNSPYNSDYGNIYGVIDLTVAKAIIILKSKGIDVIIKEFKLNIIGYYF